MMLAGCFGTARVVVRPPRAVATAIAVGAVAHSVAHAGATVATVALTGQMRITVDAWARFSTSTGGIAVVSQGAADVPVLIRDIFDRGLAPGAPVDVVFVIDTTGSMRDDIDAVKKDMRAIIAHLRARNPDHTIGLTAYRDRGDDYVSRTMLPLVYDERAIDAAIHALTVDGGGDTPEHVYAGLDTALRESAWRPHAAHHIILMGDAPPHEDYADDPRTFQAVIALAEPLRVAIHTIGVATDGGR